MHCYYYIYLSCVWASMCHRVPVELRGQLLMEGSHLQLCESQRLCRAVASVFPFQWERALVNSRTRLRPWMYHSCLGSLGSLMWYHLCSLFFWLSRQRQLKVFTLIAVVKSWRQEREAAGHATPTVVMGGRHSRLVLVPTQLALSFFIQSGTPGHRVLPTAPGGQSFPVNPT